MKKVLYPLLIIITILAFSAPSIALSKLAEDFLKQCRALDAPWPPPNWSNDDIRAAALEVLDATENGILDPWPRPFCLKALGHVKNPEDLPRILHYEETMNYTVLQSLRGFSHPDAVNCLIKYLDNEKAPKRELAAKGLSEMNFTKFDKPEVWKNKVKDAIQKALNKEKVSWLRKDMKDALEKVEAAPIK